MRFGVVVLLLVTSANVVVEAGPFRRTRPTRYVSPPASQAVAEEKAASAPATDVRPALHSVSLKGSDDALPEVNAARAKRGLRPFLPDELLNEAARSCAKIRAANLIDGHLASDFHYLPAGASASAAGCGALDPSWGWGTCCTYDNYTHAGAAWVMGADGNRYMHLFVR